MSILGSIFLGVYVFALGYITIYCLLQFHLLYSYKKHSRNNSLTKSTPKTPDNELPFVTVQLPIFNELFVVERLLENITQFDYPKDKFEIQLLDDSTDETLDISKQQVEKYKKLGFDISLQHRVDRSGYKAGALKNGMKSAKGEFIAIFDADFLPRKDFLKSTIPHFSNPAVGVVQTRWQHINQDYSIITKLQAMQLNVHFTIEQQGRKAGNYLLQFNGTAGVWRRKTIDDAGGWEADTLTEDLDLSYRAQLKGWEIMYLEKFGSPAELPVEMNGLKSQQFRWMKGGAENARKILPTVWKSDLSFAKKIHATGHLLASGIFLFVFISGIFSVPLVFMFEGLGYDIGFLKYALLGLFSVIAVYYVANVDAEIKNISKSKLIIKFLFLFPLFLALSMGLSLHNTIAVLQGYRGKKSPFIRTPKFAIQNISDSFRKKNYLAKKISWTTIFEGILAIYFAIGIIGGIYLNQPMFLIYHLLLMIGFGTICYYSIKHLGLK